MDFTVSFLEKENKINNEKLRVLDPTCGSGSFISGIIRILNQKFLQKAFVMVEGFDIRWLSVLAARTNFVLYISSSNLNLYIPIWVKDILKFLWTKDF